MRKIKRANQLHRHNPYQLSGLTDRLRRQSRKITGPRKAVLEILRKQAHPMTNREILTAMPKGRCDLATIYRMMRLLEGMGLVKQFDFGDGVARFELVSDARDAHHHHLVCTRCSDVIEIEECCSEALEKRIAAKHGFEAVTHRLEFFGICPGCQERSNVGTNCGKRRG
jgi:Fur family ferric uptake transcriptional regulator